MFVQGFLVQGYPNSPGHSPQAGSSVANVPILLPGSPAGQSPQSPGQAQQVFFIGLPSQGSAVPYVVRGGAQTPQDTRTTLVLRKLPSGMSRDAVVDLLDSKELRGSYDFFYMPWNFEENIGLGYAFVNFITNSHADYARLCLHGWEISRDEFSSELPIEASWSDLSQGIESNIERYRNSPVMHQAVPEELRPMLFNHGIHVSFPAPTKRLRQPRGLARVHRTHQSLTLTRPSQTLREGITKVVHILNVADMGAFFKHLSSALAFNMTYYSPGVCDELHETGEIVRFHKRLRDAIPDLSLAVDHASLDSWRAIGTGTQVTQLVPQLPVGVPMKFILESSVKADESGKINWICERFALVDGGMEVLPDGHGNEAQVAQARNANELRHRSSECQPCAYFAFKSAGCAKGDDCEFCHLCNKSQARMRKRSKALAQKLVKETRQDLYGLPRAESNTPSLFSSCVDDGWITDDGF